ncbi:MAG: GNAT family N-acetyltransferase [Caldilineaceae bacterium]|nr:GNAT family N-acetyltransferase [Caldilineaceae bacterium]
MMPVTPDIIIRPLGRDDAEIVAEFLNPTFTSIAYNLPMNEALAREFIFEPGPLTLFPVRWQRHMHLGAWRARQLVGFLDAATGLDSDRQTSPDYEPVGLLRFLALPERADLIEPVGIALIQAAERFWLDVGTRHIQAFHLSTGYPTFQAGAGVLPNEWVAHFRLLTMTGYVLRQRYQRFVRQLGQMIEEEVPRADVSIALSGNRNDRSYQIYYRRIDRIGGGQVIGVQSQQVERLAPKQELDPRPATPAPNQLDVLDEKPVRVAHVTNLYIEEAWRGQNIGKWMLRRMINDATIQGYDQMIAYLPQGQHVAWSLLTQQGFVETNYRGYSMDKVLQGF